jgi:hypothetical protein
LRQKGWEKLDIASGNTLFSFLIITLYLHDSVYCLGAFQLGYKLNLMKISDSKYFFTLDYTFEALELIGFAFILSCLEAKVELILMGFETKFITFNRRHHNH